MNTSHRPFNEALGDFASLARFTSSLSAASPADCPWHLPRLVDWRYNQPTFHLDQADFLSRNAELWFDGLGSLVAAAISESGERGFFILCHYGWRFLYPEILAWVEENWLTRPGWVNTELTEAQAYEIRFLEARGFKLVNECQVQLFDPRVTQGAPLTLPEGFAVVDMESGDWAAQDLLRLEAFHGPQSVNTEALAQRARLNPLVRAAPYYNARTDICVRAPDGNYAAGCEALFDPWNSYAEIERVCTRAAYRRRGLARAAIGECLRRLGEMGIRQASLTGYDEGPKALYASLGHSSAYRVLVFSRPDA